MRATHKAIVGLVAGCLAGCQAQPPTVIATSATTNRYVVAIADGADPAAVAKALEEQGLQVQEVLGDVGVITVEGSDPAVLDQAEAIAGVEVTVPSRVRPHLGRVFAASGMGDLSADVPPNPGPASESLSGYQWGLAAAHVPDAWQPGREGQGAIVAVLDTGADPDNPELRPALDLVHAKSFVATEPDVIDRNGHGSHVSGIIAAAKDGRGVVGVAPSARVLPVKVLDATGAGDDAAIMKGMAYAVAQGATVLNMSLEGLWENDAEGQRLRRAYASAIRHVISRGAVVVAAAGNEGLDVTSSGQLALPAGAEGAIAVGSVGPVDGQNPLARSLFSNYGAGFLDLVAPGGGIAIDPDTFLPIVRKTDLILSTWSTHALPHEENGVTFGPAAHMFLGGTSMAAAFTSGVAALVWGRFGPLKPELMKRHLLHGARGGADPIHYGRGPLDAQKALEPLP